MKGLFPITRRKRRPLVAGEPAPEQRLVQEKADLFAKVSALVDENEKLKAEVARLEALVSDLTDKGRARAAKH